MLPVPQEVALACAAVALAVNLGELESLLELAQEVGLVVEAATNQPLAKHRCDALVTVTNVHEPSWSNLTEAVWWRYYLRAIRAEGNRLVLVYRPFHHLPPGSVLDISQ